MWNLIITLYDCWIKLEWLALVFSTLVWQWDIFNFMFCLFIIFTVIFGGFLFAMVLAQWWRLTFWTFTNKLLVQKTCNKNTTISIARLQCYNNKSLQTFGKFFIFVFGHYWRTAHTRRNFWHLYHLKKVGGHTEHKQLKRNVTRTLFYI